MANPLLREARFRELIGWKVDGSKDGDLVVPGYNALAPILFEDLDTSDINKMFLNQSLFNVRSYPLLPDEV